MTITLKGSGKKSCIALVHHLGRWLTRALTGSRNVDYSSAAEFVLRTATVHDEPDSAGFGHLSTAHHSVSVNMVSVANSTTRDKHEDLLSSSECDAMAEREAKRRRVEWPGRVEPSEGEERVAVGVRDAGGELISMDAVEDESQYAKLRTQVGLSGGDQQTQVRIGDDFGLLDESGPSSLDEVALARQVSR